MDIERPFLADGEFLEAGMRALHQRYDIRTICNIYRRIHLLAHSEEISLLCAEGIQMAKNMDARLRYYKSDWDKGLWVPESTPLPPP